MASTSLSMSLIWAWLRMDCFSTKSLNWGMGSLACSKTAGLAEVLSLKATLKAHILSFLASSLDNVPPSPGSGPSPPSSRACQARRLEAPSKIYAQIPCFQQAAQPMHGPPHLVVVLLLLLPEFVGVRQGVPPEAVRLSLDQRGAIPPPGARNGLCSHLPHLQTAENWSMA